MPRPQEFPDRLEIRLRPEWRQRLVQLARENGRRLSDETRAAIQEHLRRCGDSNGDDTR